MKKLLTLLLVMFSCGGFAQTNILPTTGNVGIGTLNPAGKLHVYDNYRSYYVDKAIIGSTEDNLGVNYLTLHKIYTNTPMDETYVMGKISAARGGVGSWNRKLTVEVNTSSAYVTNRGSIICTNEGASLVTLDYNGASYLAIQIAKQSTLSRFSFTGYARYDTFMVLKGDEVTNVQPFTTLDPISIQGNLGVGVVNPTAKLDINGGPAWTSTGWAKTIKINQSNAIEFAASSKKFGIGATAPDGLYFFSTGVEDATQPADYRMVIRDDGNVAIGTTDPKGYKLAVAGKIRATEIKVEATPWPDYVFAKDYKLPSLKETEQHINEKGHLPGIPSAAEVKANGIDVGEMNAKLLQKIEELTLYLLQQQKEINELKAEVVTLKTKK